MHFILFALFLLISSTVCQNNNESSDQSVVQGRYHSNHPPLAEDPIPVAVVYEDDSVAGKIIKPEVEESFGRNADSNTKKVSIANEENEAEIITEHIDSSTAFNINGTDSKQYEIPVKPKTRVQSDLQIPVAVVYDSTTPENIQNQPAISDSFRRKTKQIRRRKRPSKTNIDHENPRISKTEPAKPQIETVDHIEPQNKFVEPSRPKARKTTLTKPRSYPDSVQATAVETNTKSIPRKRERDPVVPIINSESYVFSHRGNFHYSYEGGDGTKAHSEGQLMRLDNDELAGEAVTGGFSYTDKDGNDFSISYTADERGYRPIGAHLPTPPPIPPAIARALAYLATATTPEPVTKPSVKTTRI